MEKYTINIEEANEWLLEQDIHDFTFVQEDIPLTFTGGQLIAGGKFSISVITNRGYKGTLPISLVSEYSE